MQQAGQATRRHAVGAFTWHLLEGLSVARIATPWFREERQGWYVYIDGRRQFLGEHPEGAPPPRKKKGKWNAPQSIVQSFHL